MENKLQSSLEHAKKLFEQRNYDACKKELQSLLNSNYEVATCHYYLGLISLNLKNYDEAAIVFSNILKNDPKNFNCLYFLGFIAEAEKNDELAFRYYYKTLNEKPDHVNAIRAIERLNMTHRDEILHTYQPPDSNTGNINPPPIPEPNKEPMQLYDELIEAKDKDSQIAVEMIKATQIIERRPRYSAFLGSIFVRLFVIAIVVLYTWGLATNQIQYNLLRSPGIIYFFLIFVLILSFIYKIIKIKSTIVTIDRGLIQIRKGLLTRRKTLILNHKADHFGTHQSFFNQLTGDCSLLFEAEGKGRYKITGLGKIKDIDALSIKLQSLRYQLRNTPLIKSGIFG